MKVAIAKVHENLFSGDAISITAPTIEGEMTILSKHEPMVTTLKAGKLVVRTAEGVKEYEVIEGVVEVSNDQVSVLL
jgi:F-type H+-transporting ATPase subunit epsilon